MLSVDFIQPSRDGQYLAIVTFAAEGERPKLCDMALVRCDPEAVAMFPDFYNQVPRDLDEQRAQRLPVAFYFHPVKERDPRTWGASGLTIIKHHKHIALRWTRGRENARFNLVTLELLRHPAWAAAAQAWELHNAVSPRMHGAASPRL